MKTGLPIFKFGDVVIGKNGDLFKIDCIKQKGNTFLYTNDEIDEFHEESTLKLN